MRKKGVLSLALAAVLTVSMAPLPTGTVHAEEAGQSGAVQETPDGAAGASDTESVPDAGQSETEGVQKETSEDAGLPDNEELLEEYISQLLGTDAGISLYANWGEHALNEQEKAIYDVLKAKAADIAANGGSTQDMLDGGSAAMRWTYEELGVDGQQSNYQNAVKSTLKASMRKIVDVLLADCPYELYWYNKAEGGGWQYAYGMRPDDTGVTVTVSQLGFAVADAYQVDGNKYEADASKAQTAARAVEAAKAIVDKYKGVSDFEKLQGYKNEICSLTSYNSSAAQNPMTPYGDPWQIIYVFDGDPQTNVVCEGYAKAFQYLCDLTTFTSSDIVCYTVTGWMVNEAHMWNIVAMSDGRNYLVDVTNSDAGTVGAHGGLFMAGYDKAVENGYQISGMTYVYDEDTLNSYGTGEDSVLNLSPVTYDPDQEYKLDVEASRITADYGTDFRVDIVSDPTKTVEVWFNGSCQTIQPDEFGNASITYNTLEWGMTPADRSTADGSYMKEHHLVVNNAGETTTCDVWVEVDYADSDAAGITTADPNAAGWYGTSFDICPPEGYTIASTANADTQWGGQIPVQGEGSVNSVYYLRNAQTGAISRCEGTYKIDTAAPTELKAEITNETDTSLTVTVSAADAVSGIKNYGLSYVSGGSKAPVITDKGNGVFEVTGLDMRTAYTFTASASDNADHTAQLQVSASTTGKLSLENASVSVTYNKFVYDGTEKTPAKENITVMLNGTVVDPSQYDVTYGSSRIDAGTVEVTVTAKADSKDYTGTASGSYEIAKADLTVQAADQTITYGDKIKTGADQTEVSGLAAGDELTGIVLTASTDQAGTDGTVTPSAAVVNNADRGRDVTANYNITYAEGTLVIEPKTVADAKVNVAIPEEGITYDGTEKKPDVTVYDGEVLIPADEYTVTYANNVNAGDASVTITDRDGGNYAVSGTGTFRIGKGTQAVLAITGMPEGGIAYGDSFRLTTAGGSGAGTVTWSVSEGADIASITSDGTVTIKGVGDVTITAEKAGDANYNAASVQWSFNTEKANPEVGQVTYSGGTIYSTADPADVKLEKSGSTEGMLQLQDGTVFTAGTKEYTWVFVPADTEHYNTVSGTITLEISADPVVSVSVTGTPEKTQYSYRDTFEPAGLTAEVTYGSGTVREIPISEFDVVYENGDFFQIGDESVTLSYAYDGGKASFEVTGLNVSAREVKDPTVTLEKDSYTYDGTAKTPGVTVMDGDVVIPAEEYTVTYTDNVKAGTASVTIADAEGGNYVIAEKTVTFTISEKPAQPADPDKQNPDKTEKNNKNTQKDKKADKNQAVKTGDSANPTVWILMITMSAAAAAGAALTKRREKK